MKLWEAILHSFSLLLCVSSPLQNTFIMLIFLFFFLFSLLEFFIYSGCKFLCWTHSSWTTVVSPPHCIFFSILRYLLMNRNSYFNMTKFIIFSFIVGAFCILSKKSLLIPSQKSIQPNQRDIHIYFSF